MIQSDSINEILALLGERLDQTGADPIRIVVSGGAALIATGVITRGTHDLDILATRSEVDGEIFRSWPLPDYFQEAILEVAEALELSPNWANAMTSLLMVDLTALPPQVWSSIETQEFGSSLTVDFIGRDGQIYLKAWAAFGRREERDISDLRAMNVSEKEASEILEWMVKEELISPFHQERISEVMKQIGHENVVPRFD